MGDGIGDVNDVGGNMGDMGKDEGTEKNTGKIPESVTDDTSNRRPLKVRSNPLAQKFAKYLAGKSITPNQISLLSVAFAAVGMAGGLCWNVFDHHAIKIFFLIVLIIGIQGRLMCNLLDGMVAVEGGKKTPEGELYNELPDRIADILIIVGVGVGLSTWWAAELGVAAAFAAVLTAYIRALGIGMGTPSFFIGPMAKQHRMATLTAAAVLTIIMLFFYSLFAHFILYAALVLVLLGSIATCIRRLEKIKAYKVAQASVASNEASKPTVDKPTGEDHV